MVTRTGLLVTAGAAVLIAAGRVFGLVELYVAGVAAGALVVVCFVWVMLSRLDLGANRSITPPRVHAGNPARATVRLHNLRSGRTPVLRLLDPVSGTAGADLLLSPLGGGETASIAYRLPTEQRGVVDVGPLDVEVTDPFGLTRVRTRATGMNSLTVFPRVDPIPPPRQAAGPDPTSGAAHPSAVGRTGDDFYALRPYVVGDDLRRVHWASTARTGDLVVRQDELPWQGRTTVLLDQRRGSWDVQGFELAVSATASILQAAWRRGDLVRLVTTDGHASSLGSGHAHLESMFEHLALVPRSNASDPSTTARSVARSGSDGALIVVSGAMRPSEQVSLKSSARGFGRLTLVAFGPSDSNDDDVLGIEIVRVLPGSTFAATWTETQRRRSLSRMSRR